MLPVSKVDQLNWDSPAVIQNPILQYSRKSTQDCVIQSKCFKNLSNEIDCPKHEVIWSIF